MMADTEIGGEKKTHLSNRIFCHYKTKKEVEFTTIMTLSQGHSLIYYYCLCDWNAVAF